MRKVFLFVLFVFLSLISNELIAQIKHFHGTWTMIGTTYVFEFDLYLKHEEGNKVAGHFDWKAVRYDENSPASIDYYQPKIGATAKEFVRGTFNPKTNQYLLKGYKKDDPQMIISTDIYRLQLDEYDDIGGDSKAHNTWLGRINGSAVKKNAA